MKPSLSTVMLGLCLVACAPQAAEPPPKPAAKAEPAPEARPAAKADLGTLLKLSTRYAGKGDSAKASRYASLAVKQYPEQPDAWAILGLTEAQAGKLAEAVASYEKSLALGQKKREVFEQLASVYDIQKRYAEAVRVYESYLELDPSDPVMLHQMGLTLLGTQDYKRAIEHLLAAKKALSSSEVPAELYIDLGYAYIITDNWPRARENLGQVFDPGKQNPMPIQLVFNLVSAMTQPSQALELIDTFGEQPPTPQLSKIRSQVAEQAQ